ncbi:prenyltransferase [Halovenus sp. HT40]|uniref:prenyltransferase n=1 Tax=Halovenus sp. HT40 TaxID=3126691 RepID=UPI00300F4CCE
MAATRTLARVIFETSRPSQLVLVLGVYAFGAKIALASGATLSVPALLSGAVVLLPLAASIHYANEYADYETDAMTDRTPFSGGSGALHRTGLPRTVPLAAGAVSLAAGIVLTAALAFVGLLPVRAVAILAVSVAFGWQYSVGPLKLAWRGLGELDNAVLGGLALPVYAAAVLDGPLGFVALASVPFFLLVLLNLFATQWPDREADERAGKRTLAVQWPKRRLRYTYVGIAVLAALSLLILAVDLLPAVVVGASLPVTPLVVWGASGYTERTVPWPTVTAMVALLALQAGAWCWLLVT